MDKLKDFVERHRDEFDGELLPEGHLERFESRIGKRGNMFVKLVSFATVLAAACAAALLFMPDRQIEIKLPSIKSPFICEADEEIDGLREYYNMRIYDIEEQIENLYNSKPSQAALEVMEESKQVIGNTYDFEENILPTLPCTDDGLSIVNLQYESSLQSLNFMLEQMEDIANKEEFYN